MAKRFGFWAIAALVCSSWLVEREGGLVTAALEDWISSSWWDNAGAFSVEVTLKKLKILSNKKCVNYLDRVEALVPLRLIFRESSGELNIAFADGSSARAESVGALDVLASVGVGQKVESVAEFFASAPL